MAGKEVVVARKDSCTFRSSVRFGVRSTAVALGGSNTGPGGGDHTCVSTDAGATNIRRILIREVSRRVVADARFASGSSSVVCVMAAVGAKSAPGGRICVRRLVLSGSAQGPVQLWGGGSTAGL